MAKTAALKQDRRAQTQNTGGVPVGYKQTEVGVIPEDWKIKTFKSDARLKARIGWQGLTTSEYLDSGDFFLVTGTEFIDGQINWDECHFVERSRYDQDKNIQLVRGDVLVTKDGTIGKVAYISTLPKPATLNSGVFVIRALNEAFEHRFLFYVLKSPVFKQFLGKLSAGSTINHLYQKDFIGFQFAAPPTKKEQEAIATALGDVDDLIASLDALIVKKRDIKKAAMQQLLTGKTRLPGFEKVKGYKQTEVGVIPEDWQIKTFKSDAKLKARIGWQGLTTSEYLDSGDFYLVTGTEFTEGQINWNDCHFVERSRYDQDKNIQLVPGDVLVTKDGTIGKVAYISTLPKPATLNSGVFVIRALNDAFEHRFLFYILMSPVFKQFLGKLSAGSTINHLYQKDFVGFQFAVPSSREEQGAIAVALSDIDEDIASLEAKHSKAVLMKTAMMQELLTGRTRLL